MKDTWVKWWGNFFCMVSRGAEAKRVRVSLHGDSENAIGRSL